MKKTKILTVLGVLLALGITACGGSKASSKSEEKSSQSQPASSVEPAPASSSEPASTPDTSAPAQDSSSSSAVAHVHVFNEEDAEVTKQPTCTETGTKIYYCECGETKTETIKKLGHDFGEWTVKTPATCTVDGKEERECSRCHEKEEKVIKAAHDWDTAQEVAAGTDPANQVAYTLASCKVCHAIKAEILAKDAKFYKGGIKSGTPSSSFKLNSKNDKAYWRFTVAGTKMYKGMLYQYAAMDQWSGNTERSYAQTSTSGDHAPTYPLGNFDAMVNGDRVDKTQWIDTSYSELLAEGDDSSELMGDNYSPVALAPMGECVIQPGLNEITYERLGSYNLIINKLVFIGTEYEHTHAAATEWSSDADGHWHACTALGCPNKKADAPVAHTFEDKADDARNKAPTCAQEGAKVEKCSVCGYEKVTPIDKIAHTYPNDGAYEIKEAATCQAAGSKERTCSVCNEKDVQPIAKLDHTFGDAVENYAAVTEGENQHVAETAHNCSVCNNAAIRWAATAYDVTKSTDRSTDVPESRDSGKAIRFSSTPNYSGGDATVKGCHIVYNVSIPADATNVGLAVYSTKRNDINTVFAKNEGDSSKGYEYVDGQLVRPDSRYGLKVDGQVIILNADSQTWKADTKAWYEFPVVIPSLTAGVHEIEIYNLGGYRADFYEFELTNLPHVEPSHAHNGGDAWVTDDNDHWHVCTAEGCPLPEGGVYDKAAHDFGEVQVVTPATCTTKGAGTKECSVCHKVVDVEIAALGHNYAPTGEVTVDGTKASQTFVCSVCSDSKTVTGANYGTFGWADALQNNTALDSGKFVSGAVYEFVIFNVPSAGTYVLTLPMKGSNGNGARVLNGNGQGFVVKANGEEATFLGNGKTYAEFFGDNQTVWVDVDFAEVTLQAGYNVITINPTTGYYRVSANAAGNITLAPKA